MITKSTRSPRFMTSLPGKFVLLLISIIFVMLVATMYIFDYQIEKMGASSISKANKDLVYNTLYQEWKNKNRSRAELIASKISIFMKENNTAEMAEFLKHVSKLDVQYIQLSNKNDDVLYKFFKDKITEAKVRAVSISVTPGASMQVPISPTELSSKYGLSIVTVPVQYNKTQLGMLQIGYATNDVEETLNFIDSQMTITLVDAVNSLQRWVILFLMIILLIIIGTGVYIGRDVDSSLKQLLEGAKEISAGNLTHKLDVHSQDEMQIIADSLNKMTSELQEKTVSKSYLNNIVESIPNMLVVLTPDLKIRSVNRSAIKKMQYSLAEMLDQPLSSIIKSPEMATGPRKIFEIDDLRRNIHVQNAESLFVKKNGEVIPVVINASLVYDSKKNLESIICVAEDISSQKKTAEPAPQIPLYDYLTGLPNRTQFDKMLNKYLASAIRNREKLAVLILGLDDFKKFSASLGHEYADLLLKKISERLSSLIENNNFLAKIDNDVFGIILTDISSEETVGVEADKILNILSNPFQISDMTSYVSANIGLATYPESSDNASILIQHAQSALDKAKELSTNTYRYFSEELNRKQKEIKKIEEALFSAYEENKLEVMYEPIYDIKSNLLIGFESKIRWIDDQMGEVPPDVFMPIAETSGLIVSISEYVLKKVFMQIGSLSKEYQGAILPISIRLYPEQLRSVDIIKFLTNLMTEHQVNAEFFKFEVSEIDLMKSLNTYETLFMELSALGFSVSITNFGTGISSILHLKKLSLNDLKIDQSFVKKAYQNDSDAAVARSIINLAKNLGLDVIADGVDKREQVDFLLVNGCHYAQGQYFSHMMTQEAMKKLLLDQMRS